MDSKKLTPTSIIVAYDDGSHMILSDIKCDVDINNTLEVTGGLGGGALECIPTNKTYFSICGTSLKSMLIYQGGNQIENCD